MVRSCCAVSLTEWLGPLFSTGDEKLFVWLEPAVADDSDLTLRQADFLAMYKLATGNELRAILGLPPQLGDSIAAAVNSQVNAQFAALGASAWAGTGTGIDC